MIFLIMGRIGSGVSEFLDKMHNAGFPCVNNDLAKLDGTTIPASKLPRYAAATPETMSRIIAAFPTELFHVIYVKADTDRKAHYIANSTLTSDEATAEFDKLETAECKMFDEFDTKYRSLNDEFENFRAIHTLTNDFGDNTLSEWVLYFAKYHTMYHRIINMAKLAIKHKILCTDTDNNVILTLKDLSEKPVSVEHFADILISDDAGLSMLTRFVLESATAEEIASIGS